MKQKIKIAIKNTTYPEQFVQIITETLNKAGIFKWLQNKVFDFLWKRYFGIRQPCPMIWVYKKHATKLRKYVYILSHTSTLLSKFSYQPHYHGR